MIRPIIESESLSRVFDEILDPSFPPAELMPRDEFIQGAVAGHLDVLGAYQGDACVGVIVGARIGNAMLVVWLAVGDATRGSGAGSALVEAGLDRWIKLPGIQLVLGEVERPDLFDAHPTHGDPARRLAFYARFGAGALALPYYQPAISADMPRVPGLLLVALAATDPTPLPRLLNPAETVTVREFLSHMMGAPSADDVQTIAVFDAIDDPRGVRLLPLEDYAEVPLPPGERPGS